MAERGAAWRAGPGARPARVRRREARPERLWRFEASNTHLYPGARLQLTETDGWPAVADAVQVCFADCGVASGHVAAIDGPRLCLDLQGYRTARGTAVAPKRWILESGLPDACGWRVAARAEPGPAR